MRQTFNAYTMQKAGVALGYYFQEKAHRLHKDIGIGYTPADDAPNNFSDLVAHVNRCLTMRQPVKVWEGGSDATIYGCAESNYAFRFVHDMGHFAWGYDFTFEDEVKLSRKQGQDVSSKFGRDSLEFLLYRVDTEGQSHYADITGGDFPKDQALFVFDVICRIREGLSLRHAVSLSAHRR